MGAQVDNGAGRADRRAGAGTTHAGAQPAAAHRIDVLVFDDHDLSRLGLAVLLRREGWVRRCALAAERRQAAELVRRNRPDVAVVDVTGVGPFVGLLVETLRAPHPALRILLTARAPVPTAPLRHVPARFLPVGTPAREVVAGVLAAARERPLEVAAVAPADPLTPREREVLNLLATGLTNREIAAQLHLGPDSVKKHASSIYRKLGVRNRTEATQFARTAPGDGG